MSLRDLLVEVGAGHDDVAVVGRSGELMTWTRADVPFVVLSADGHAVEFALDPLVAAAAARTPDATPSRRGPGWVRFSPGVLDDHGGDRVVAWFASAHRRLTRN